ncbi:MAG: hypothetical protein QXG86_00775 [Candidatus Woesearchaeota archaeon]
MAQLKNFNEKNSTSSNYGESLFFDFFDYYHNKNIAAVREKFDVNKCFNSIDSLLRLFTPYLDNLKTQNVSSEEESEYRIFWDDANKSTKMINIYFFNNKAHIYDCEKFSIAEKFSLPFFQEGKFRVVEIETEEKLREVLCYLISKKLLNEE